MTLIGILRLLFILTLSLVLLLGSASVLAAGSASPDTQQEANASGVISGTVTDVQTSQPIEGATVNDGTRQATTDSNGSYSIIGVPEGNKTVTASVTGNESAWQTISVTAGATTTADFALTLLPTSLNGTEPLTVALHDISPSYDGLLSWLWDFGNGETSAEQNPIYTYIQDGVYTVSLTVTE